MSTRTIKKAKLKNGILEVELLDRFRTENKTNVTNEIAMKCAGIAHEDLVNAFKRLAIHLVVICDLKKSELIDHSNIEAFDLDLISEYSAKGFTIGGSDEHEGVVIIGSRRFASGKVLNIVTPFTKFTDENDTYKFAGQLYDDIMIAVFEVEQYLDGKYGVKQLEIQFEPELVEES